MLTKNSTTMISLNDLPRLGNSNHYLHSTVLYKHNVAQFTIHICGLRNTGVSFYTFLKTLCFGFEYEEIKQIILNNSENVRF